MKHKRKDWITAVFVSTGFILLCFGEAWLIAWISNPHITTGTVNFFAGIFAMICNSIRTSIGHQ